jgi:hypothetical protein
LIAAKPTPDVSEGGVAGVDGVFGSVPSVGWSDGFFGGSSVMFPIVSDLF